ncbi:histidine kinase, partial [Pseudomonas sp. FW305-47B]|uniref:CHASE3 domain-containing protein n=1 Tax=Pseudomonas sp. FW305-47B TaxID=2070558 RepID=UPI000CB8AE78
TRAAIFKTDHDKAVAAVIPALDRVKGLTAANPEQRDNIEKLSSVIESRLGQFSMEMDLLSQGQADKAAALVSEAAAADTTATIGQIATAMMQ